MVLKFHVIKIFVYLPYDVQCNTSLNPGTYVHSTDRIRNLLDVVGFGKCTGSQLPE